MNGRILCVWLLLIGAAAVHLPMAAAGATAWKVNPDAERWIRKQVLAGEPADLNAGGFSKDSSIVSAAFVKDLLTSPALQTGARGVRIRNAAIAGALGLEGEDVAREVWLEGCLFGEGLDFSFCRFRKSLSLAGSYFPKNAFLAGMKVDENLYMRGAVFAGESNFNSMDIGGMLAADAIEFTRPHEPAVFNGMKVGVSARLAGATFAGPADFRTITVAQHFLADGMQFQSTTGTANFIAAKIGGQASLKLSGFAGPVDFGSAVIGGDLSLQGSIFTNTSETISFNRTSIGGIASFDRAVFDGSVDFTSAFVKDQIHLDEARFTNRGGYANFSELTAGTGAWLAKTVFRGSAGFSRIRIGGDLTITGATFDGPVSFTKADVGGTLLLVESRFADATEGANFSRLHVKGDFMLANDVFEGPVQFDLADFEGPFLARAIRFRAPRRCLEFKQVNAAKMTVLREITFGGPVNIKGSVFDDLTIEGANATSPVVPLLDLSDTIIHRKFQLRDLAVDQLVAASLHIAGPAQMENVSIRGLWNLELGNFDSLVLSKVEWPKTVGQVRLDGMTYKYINDTTPGPQRASGARLISLLLKCAPYNAQVYTDLEASFRRQGYRDLANEVFVAHKRRERSEVLGGFAWMVSWLGDHFLGFGRRLGPPLRTGLLVIIIGWLVAWRLAQREKWWADRMLPAPAAAEAPRRLWQRNEARTALFSFWYTLYLFSPFTLGDGSLRLKEASSATLGWMLSMRIVGLIILGALFGALTGIIQ